MRTLYIKFVVMTIGIMVLSGILAFVVSNVYYQQRIKPFNDQKNTNVALSIAAFAANNPKMNLNEYLENISTVGYQIYLVEETGKEYYFGSPFRDKSLLDSTKKRVLAGDFHHGILEFPQETFVTGFFANELKNTIGVPLRNAGRNYALFIRPDIKLLFSEMHFLFGWILILSITLSIVMVVFSTKYLVKPITNLTKATKSLSKGKFNVNLDINRQDELGELSQSFLQMARKLEQMEDMRKEFISNISHDIQSPLSNIKGYTNLLENESIKQEDRKQYIAIINDEIERLSLLTKQLLLLASLDRDENMMKKKRFYVSDQLKELIRTYQWLVNEKGIMLSYSLPDTEIIGDPSLLHTVWDNLFRNAIKYNKPHGSINISITNKGESIHVAFEDTGIGLRYSEVVRIFDRFYRADTARSRTIEGTGLGLSIVKTIVHHHGGHIEVWSKENEGSTFVVEIPVKSMQKVMRKMDE